VTRLKDDLDLRKLEVFYWVAELGSFSLAAAHLKLRQPTVSAHVHELELRVGGKVLNRIGGEVVPTALGQMLMERAKSLLAFKRETLSALDDFHGRIKGELPVGGSNIPGEYILPSKLGAFMRKFPEVKPVLRIGDSAQIIKAVVEGQVELGFVGFKSSDPQLSFQRLWKDEMVLVVPRNHPWARARAIDLKALRGQPFISREGGSGTLGSFRALLSRRGEDPDALLNVVMELGSTEAIKEALLAGLGVSILSRTSVLREISSGLLSTVAIRGLKLERDFYQVLHRRRTLSPVARAFRSFIKDP
jgi:DNA-binding transcriptional LysR family regulator